MMTHYIYITHKLHTHAFQIHIHYTYKVSVVDDDGGDEETCTSNGNARHGDWRSYTDSGHGSDDGVSQHKGITLHIHYPILFKHA